MAGSLSISVAPIGDHDAEIDEPAELAALHLECEDCESGGSCFVLYASRQTPVQADVAGECAYCHHTIVVGQPILVATILVADEERLEDEQTAQGLPTMRRVRRVSAEIWNQSRRLKDRLGQTASSVVTSGKGRTVDASMRRVRSIGNNVRHPKIVAEQGTKVVERGFVGLKGLPRFASGQLQDLPPKLKRKLQRAGGGQGRGTRTRAETEEIYTRTIDRPVRNLGEEWDFINGKDLSHKEAFANNPSRGNDPRNLVWENSKRNRARGDENMSGWHELLNRVENRARASRIVAKSMMKSAVRGGILAAVSEGAISATLNSIHVKRGRKSVSEATWDVAHDTAKAGVAGAVVAAGFTAVGAAGGGTVVTLAAPFAAAYGLADFAYVSMHQLGRAITEPIPDKAIISPLESKMSFHVECTECDSSELCHDAFLRHIVTAATT